MIAAIAPKTVIEAFLPAYGDVPLAVVYDTANLAGIDDHPLRLAIRRLIGAGDVAQHGRGRAGSLTLTAAGRHRLQRDRHSLALSFAQDAGEAPWDGRWHLIAVSVPERHRAIRDVLRRELLEVGAATISTGLYASPHDLLSSLSVAAGAYLSTATTDDLDLRGTTDPRAIAETLWPHAPVVAAYAVIEEALRKDAADTSTPTLVRQLQLADALDRAMRNDPLLPLELRGDTWPPTAIRAAWARQWDALRQASGNLLYEGWWPPTTWSSVR